MGEVAGMAAPQKKEARPHLRIRNTLQLHYSYITVIFRN